MTLKLSKAVRAVKKLPQAQQDALADLLLEAAASAAIDDFIAAGEAPFAEYGGRPLEKDFERLIAKYGARSPDPAQGRDRSMQPSAKCAPKWRAGAVSPYFHLI